MRISIGNYLVFLIALFLLTWLAHLSGPIVEDFVSDEWNLPWLGSRSFLVAPLLAAVVLVTGLCNVVEAYRQFPRSVEGAFHARKDDERE